VKTTSKVSFRGATGTLLDARLDLPAGRPVASALFAHCFTCDKQSAAATRISRALADAGLSVLRFDFTGLGGSEGDFSNTNFTSNVEDLIAAAQYLREHHRAPSLIIGHSLGGTAAIAASARIPETRAVATLNAPADPAHVERLLSCSLDEIAARGEAEVSIGGRPFRITKQFLQDIAEQDLTAALSRPGKALLVLHAPTDAVVGIDNARHLFEAARHPKSFVALDGADHLLSKREDATYAAGVLAAWASRYVVSETRTEPPPPEGNKEHRVVVAENHEGKLTQSIEIGSHHLTADEPVELGGLDMGPSPYDLLLAALGACTAMTLRMYASHKKLALEDVRVTLRHEKIHARDCESCETQDGKVDRIFREVELVGDLTPDQRLRILQIADKCPVHRTLHAEVKVDTRLVE